jgi:hypothetical protein
VGSAHITRGYAHSVSLEQFEAFHRIMMETVLPETYPGWPPPGYAPSSGVNAAGNADERR